MSGVLVGKKVFSVGMSSCLGAAVERGGEEMDQ